MSIHWGGRGAGHVSRLSTSTTGVPTLALNFLSGSLDPRVTFTRSSTATFVGSNGLIQSAAVDTPRFDYDPVTLAPRGLLIEEQRTNLFLNSLIDGTSLSTQSVTVTAVAHTISFYGTGTITLTGAATATVTGTGVYPNRRTLSFTPIVGVLICTVSGSVQYAQIEAGAFATSFIPTAGATATRSADVATMTGTNFSSWYNQSEGTFVCSADTADANTANRSIYYASNAGSTDIVYGVAGTLRTIRVLVSGGETGGASAGAFTNNVPAKTAGAYKVNDFAASFNGGTVATDTVGAVPTTVDRLTIGTNTALQSLLYLNGHVRSIAYYNTRLPNTTLRALTA